MQRISFSALFLLLVFSISSCSKKTNPTAIPSATGSVIGVIKYIADGQAITQATITTVPPTTSVLTDTIGCFTIAGLSSGSCFIKAERISYFTDSIQVSVTAGSTTTANMSLRFNPTDSLPERPMLLSPADSSYMVSLNPVFCWVPAINAATYTLQVSTSRTFDQFIYNQDGLTDVNQQVRGLNPSACYYWRMDAVNSHGVSAWTKIRQFITGIIWLNCTPMPEGRWGLCAAAVNGKIYAIVGYNSFINPGRVDEYDPGQYHWTTKAAAPCIKEAACAVSGDQIYIFGGCNYNTGAYLLNTTYQYRPTTDTWLECAPMPSTRQWASAATIGDKIYVIGGFDTINSYYTSIGTTEEYDPATNTWVTKATMPTARHGMATGVVNGKIYCIGGTNWSGTIFSTVEVYDPSSNTWSTVAPMPTNRQALSAGVVNNMIYAFGGQNSGGDLSTVEQYDPVTNIWTPVDSMPSARTAFAAATCGGFIYLVGGLHGLDIMTTNIAFNPAGLKKKR